MHACHSTKVFPKTKYTISKERGEKEEGGGGGGGVGGGGTSDVPD